MGVSKNTMDFFPCAKKFLVWSKCALSNLLSAIHLVINLSCFFPSYLLRLLELPHAVGPLEVCVHKTLLMLNVYGMTMNMLHCPLRCQLHKFNNQMIKNTRWLSFLCWSTSSWHWNAEAPPNFLPFPTLFLLCSPYSCYLSYSTAWFLPMTPMQRLLEWTLSWSCSCLK